MPIIGGQSHAHFTPTATNNYVRALPTETVNISETLARVAAHPRVMATQTIPVSESLVRLAAHPRVMATETIPVSETSSKQFTSVRVLPTQTTAISETLARVSTNSRAIATQTVTIGETLTEIYSANRALAVQTTTIGETLARSFSTVRALATETTTIGETSASRVTNTRALAIQTVPISETLSETYAAIRALPIETVTISETRAAVRTLSRALAVQTIAIGESMIRRYQSNRPLPAETIPISETRSVVRTLTRLLTETVPIVEDLERIFATVRALPTQTTAISETSSTLKTTVRALATETVAIGESLTKVFNGIRTLPPEDVDISETLSEMYAATRTLPTQVVTIGETLARRCNVQRLLATQTTTIGESLSEIYAATRVLPTQVVAISETSARQFTGIRLMAPQTTVIAESLTTRKAFFRATTETTVIAETLARTFTGIRILDLETTDISDSSSRLYGAVRPLAAETVTIAETLARLYAATRILTTETTTVAGGTLARLISLSRALAVQTVAATGTLTRQFIGSRILAAQTTTISDSVASLYTPAPPPGIYERQMPLEFVSITESLNRVVTNSRTIQNILGISLDGVDDYIACGNDATLWSQTLTTFSFSFWMYYDVADSVNNRFFLNHGGFAAQCFYCHLTTTQLLNFTIRNAANTPVSAQSSAAQGKAAQWIHVAGVYDSTLGSNNIKVYVNNVLGATQGALTQTINLSAVLGLGLEAAGANQFKHDGLMKDFRWFTSKALTTTEVNDIYNDAPTAPVPDYWLPMREGSGNPLDIISGTKTGTLTNGATWQVNPEIVPISESLVRSFSTVRLLPTETVPVTESVARQQTLTRQMGRSSLFLDNIDDSISIPNRAAINNLDDYTIAFWLYPTINVAPSTPNIVIKQYPSNNGFILYFTGNSLILNFRTVGNTGVGVSVSNTTYMQTNGFNRWYHIAATVTRSTGAMKLYIDGILRNSGTNVDIGANLSGTVANLGINAAGAPNKFAGNIRDFRLYRSAQDAAIPDIMNESATAPTPDFWLKFNEGNGTPIDTLAPLGVVTLTGNPAWALENDTTPITESMTKQQALIRQMGRYGIFLDGVNDYITLGSDVTLWNAPLTQFSFSLWINPSELNNASAREIFYRGWGQAYGFDLYVYVSGNKIEFEVASTPWPTRAAAGSVIVSGINRWHHITCVYDSTLPNASVLKMYYNASTATFVQTSGVTGVVLTNATGALIGGPANEFWGYMKDLRWYQNKALTQTEVTNIYNNSVSAPVPDYWLQMREGFGNPVDSISGTKTGVLTGGASWVLDNETTFITESLARRSTNQRIISETIPIIESQVRTYNSFRTLPAETVDISESSDRILASVRTFIENTAISETLERLVSIFRNISELIPISESLNKALILIRELPAETTDIGETLARKFTGIRILPTQTTTIGESLTKVFNGIRTLPTQVVAITSSVARLLAANRPMPTQTITISEQLKRSFGTIRTLLATVVITSSLGRIYSGSRYLVEDIAILESLRILAKVVIIKIFPPALPQRRTETKGSTNLLPFHPDRDTLDYRTYLRDNPPMSERSASAPKPTRKKVETITDREDLDAIDF